jgi:hypothetical protein
VELARADAEQPYQPPWARQEAEAWHASMRHMALLTMRSFRWITSPAGIKPECGGLF